MSANLRSAEQPSPHSTKPPSRLCLQWLSRLRVLLSSTNTARTLVVLCVCILVLAILIPPLIFHEELFVHKSWSNSYKQYVAQAISKSYSIFSPKTAISSARWKLPPHIETTYKLHRNAPQLNRHALTHWTRPYVFLHYTRPYPTNRSQTELFIYATGVTMGAFDRGFVVHGCLVGDDVYPCEAYPGDVYSCTVLRPISKGEFISLVVPRNEYVDQQLNNTVQINDTVNVTLHHGDLVALPNHTRLHGDHLYNGPHSLMYVNSHQRFEALGDDRDPEAPGSEPRYEVCLATQIKPFTNYLPQWIAYYKRIGVDMVYIIDNDADEDLSQVYKHRDDVQVLYWPWRRSQTQALSYMTVAARPRCEWIIMADVDEFAMLGIGKQNQLADKQVLRSYLRRRLSSSYKQFMFWFLVMGNSGYVEAPEKPMPEAYIHKFSHQSKNGKSVAYTDHWWKNCVVHRFGGVPSLQAPVQKNASNLYEPVDEDDQPIMVHYHHRAVEDHITKEKYGSASTTDGKRDPVASLFMPKDVPKWVTKVDDQLTYTYFRDIYRAIMEKPFDFKQTLVRKSMGQRCIARRMSGGNGRVVPVQEEP